MKFKINTIEKEIPENVVNFLESDAIGMTNCQSFYPLLRKFHRGKSIEKCKLKNPYEVINLEKINESMMTNLMMMNQVLSLILKKGFFGAPFVKTTKTRHEERFF